MKLRSMGQCVRGMHVGRLQRYHIKRVIRLVTVGQNKLYFCIQESVFSVEVY